MERSEQDRIALKKLGERFRDLRLARGLTQDELGERAGFTGKYVSEIERGLRDIPFSTLRALVEVGLGGTMEDMLSELAPRRRQPGPAPLPRGISELARRIAALPPEVRRKVLSMLRTILAFVS